MNGYDLVRLQPKQVKNTGDTMTGNLTMSNGSKVIGELQGNSSTTTKLKTPVNITVGNKTIGFDGSQSVSFPLSNIGASPITHNHPSSSINLLTGYSKGTYQTPILETDSLNVALAKLENSIGKGGSSSTITGNYLPLTGGTVTGKTIFQKGITSSDVSEFKGIKSIDINPSNSISYWSLSSTGTLSCQVLDVNSNGLIKGKVTLHNTIEGLKSDGSQSWNIDRDGNAKFDQLMVNQEGKFHRISSTLTSPTWSINDSGNATFNSIGSYVNLNTWSIDGGGIAKLQTLNAAVGINTNNLTTTGTATIGSNLTVSNGIIKGKNNITLNRDSVYTPIYNTSLLSDYLKLGGGYLSCTDDGVFNFIKNNGTSNTVIANGSVSLAHNGGQSSLVDYIRLGSGMIACASSGSIHMQTAGAAKTTLYVGNIVNTYSLSPTTFSRSNKSVFDDINNIEVVETNDGYRLTKSINENDIITPTVDKKSNEDEINIELNSAIAILWKASQELKQENQELKSIIENIKKDKI